MDWSLCSAVDGSPGKLIRRNLVLRGLDNGPLLDAAEAGFDVMLTCDQNVRYQQNLTGKIIRIDIATL